MSTGPQLVPPTEPRERNWVPVAVAAGALLIVAALIVLLMERSRGSAVVAPLSADPYASSLPVSDVKMSESANLAGGKVTYIDGHITNTGSKTVTGISVRVLFRNVANEVAQNESQTLKWIRTRDPYVDLEPVSAAPLGPGGGQDFRLIFDAVTPDWNGVYPEIRIVQVEAR